MTLVLKVTPVFCGEASVGTVGLIKLLRSHLDLSLPAAKGIVDRCVFEFETVDIPLPDSVDAAALVDAIRALDSPAEIDATIRPYQNSRQS